MCGIFATITKNINPLVETQNERGRTNGMKSKHRGPDSTQETTYKCLDYDIFFMFHRLAINGQDQVSNQPFEINNISLMCNGEIYNYKELAHEYNIDLETNSDCEIIIHLYQRVGIQQMISLLDGVFSFVLLDKTTNMVYIGHDPLGIRSLYMTTHNNGLLISSEMKCLTDYNGYITMIKPGVYHSYNLNTDIHETYTYFSLIFETTYTNDIESIGMIRELLFESVKKRLLSDRPIGCLLSGGLDSSIIASIMCKLQEPNQVKTFSIGFEGSPDVLAAENVASYLGTNHTSVIVNERDMLDAIEPTIQQIESYDTTTVRASVPMYLLSKFIKEHTDIAVILSGEGADELSGSYLYFHKAPNSPEFQSECIRLVKDVQHFDVLRGDKTTAGNSLEIRVPFFDKGFVQNYMSIDPELKMCRSGYEKYLLRCSFSDDLPETIVWRRKEGFSDGVSSLDKPWYEVINDYTTKLYNMNEKDYYKSIFSNYYKGYEYIVPYEWLPKWCNETNPSGRLLL